MTNIPGYNYDTPINEMPTINELLHTYKPYNIIHTRKGTYNQVSIIETNSGKKLAVRISKKYFFDVNNTNNSAININPTLLNDYEPRTILENLEQSKKNWISAAENNLCPEIYYYGFFKELKYNINYLYLMMISEAYDMDLGYYYNNSNNLGYKSKMTGNLSEVDIYIAQQLMDLINKISSKMFLICFDIKPFNCVINISTNEVKLIDWDGDWCHNYKSLLKKRADSQVTNISLISQIVMANHFYSWCRWNIFSSYFNDNVHLYPKQGNYDALEHLFCKLNEHYNTMSKHYFKINAVDCQGIFKIMVARIYELSPPADYTININGGGPLMSKMVRQKVPTESLDIVQTTKIPSNVNTNNKQVDNNIAIVLITTHGIYDREFEYENSIINFEKINAVKMDMCNFLTETHTRKITEVLLKYIQDNNITDLKSDANKIASLLKNISTENLLAEPIVANIEDVSFLQYKKKFIDNLNQSYNISSIKIGEKYINKYYQIKVKERKEGTNPFYNSITLLNEPGFPDLIQMINRRTYHKDKQHLYLSEIIDYLHYDLHKNNVIIIDLACSVLNRDEPHNTERDIRAENRKSRYGGGKRNKRKTNKRKTNKRKTNKRKTNKRKTNKRKTKR